MHMSRWSVERILPRFRKECDLLPNREEELKSIMGEVVGKRVRLEQIVMFDDHIDFVLEDGSVKMHVSCSYS